jgi:TolB-like protein/Flp pilus assembly protein TadD
MSPEQAKGEAVDHRTDIWSLGVVMYEMLTGTMPFLGDYEPAVVYSILNEHPDLISGIRREVPATLEDLVERALAKDPAKRHQSADELLTAIGEQGELLAAGAKPRRFVGWKRFRRNRPAFYGSIAAVAVIVVIALSLIYQHATATIDSLAVLPVVDLSADPLEEYYTEGLTGELITKLSRIRAWQVKSRATMMHYRNSEKSLREIADDLDVKAIVAATIQRVGNEQIKFAAELTQASSEEVLWSDEYEGSSRDIENIQSRVIRTVAAELGVTIPPEIDQILTIDRPVDPIAYEAYLEGRKWWNMEGPQSIQKALESFQRAIEIDSTIALAYAGVGDCYVIMGCHGMGRPHEVYPRARKAINKAMKLDPTLAEAHTALAHMVWEYDWDFETAEDEFKKAIDLNPSYATAHHIYGGFLITEGRTDESAKQMKIARDLDPLSQRLQADVAMTLAMRRKFADALAQIEKTQEMYPEWDPAFDLALVQELQGNSEEAIRILENAKESTDSVIIPAKLAGNYARAGRISDASVILAGLVDRYNTDYYPPVLISQAYVTLGDTNQALTWLEKGLQERDPLLVRLRGNWQGHPLRDEPRFQAILKRAGFID